MNHVESHQHRQTRGHMLTTENPSRFYFRVKGVQKIPDIGPYIVAAMDNELLELCQRNNIPAFYARSADIIGDKAYLGTDPAKQQEQRIGSDRYYRTDGAAFKKMGAVKATTLQVCFIR